MKNPTARSINKKVLAGAVVVAGLLIVYVLLLLNGVTFAQNARLTPKANITVLAVGSVPTPDLSLLTVTSTATSSPSETVNGISINTFVKIAGTEGAGLRIRNNPGTDSEVNFLANESEVFLVIGGPQTVGGVLWWQLAAPYDKNRQGWASAEYLVAVTDN